MENLDEEFSPAQKAAAASIARDIFIGIGRFERNLKSLDEEKFIQVFGPIEGARHWQALMESNLTVSEYGKQHFDEQQKKEMVAFLKSN